MLLNYIRDLFLRFFPADVVSIHHVHNMHNRHMNIMDSSERLILPACELFDAILYILVVMIHFHKSKE